jgi:hypothetical protein
MADSLPKQWCSILKRCGIGSAICLASFFLMGCSHWMSMEREAAASSLPSQTEVKTDPPFYSDWNIDGLENCLASSVEPPISNDEKPVMILVHGLRGSAQSFNRLAQQLQAAGHQPICFLYNDRDSLVSSSAKLTEALKQLVHRKGGREIIVLGHSLGALVARRALTSEHWKTGEANAVQFKLVTVAGPFGGVSTASGCTSPTMKFLTLGLVIPLCKMVSGDKWAEITYRSEFIRYPGHLSRNVGMHLKIETDEEQGCLVYDEKICRISDFVFSLDEQRNSNVDADKKVKIVMVKAGHGGVLGNEHVFPSQLILALGTNRILSMPENQLAKAGSNSLAQSQSNSAGSSGQPGY